MAAELNPYSPTSEVCSAPIKPKPAGSFLIAGVSAVCALAFTALTIMLLRSGASDVEAGMMFMFNIPLMVGLAVSAARSTRFAACIACGAVIVQAVIAVCMLIGGIGDFGRVIGVNLSIILVVGSIALWSWHSFRRSAPS